MGDYADWTNQWQEAMAGAMRARRSGDLPAFAAAWRAMKRALANVKAADDGTPFDDEDEAARTIHHRVSYWRSDIRKVVTEVQAVTDNGLPGGAWDEITDAVIASHFHTGADQAMDEAALVEEVLDCCASYVEGGLSEAARIRVRSAVAER
jgi:hypothetical protein